jgi:DNA mismatch endonuclease (patch repair protein)
MFWSDKFKKNIQRDINKREQLESLGWKVITIWECKLKNEIDSCIEEIKSNIFTG